MNRRDRRADESRQRKAGYESESYRALRRTVESMAMGKSASPDKVASSPCGHCGKVLDGATSADGVTAEPGDITVCLYCAGVNTFGGDMQLQRMTEDEVEAHEASDDIRSHQDLIRSALTRAAMGSPKTRHQA